MAAAGPDCEYIEGSSSWNSHVDVCFAHDVTCRRDFLASPLPPHYFTTTRAQTNGLLLFLFVGPAADT